jgi:hypothetical protein
LFKVIFSSALIPLKRGYLGKCLGLGIEVEVEIGENLPLLFSFFDF